MRDTHTASWQPHLALRLEDYGVLRTDKPRKLEERRLGINRYLCDVCGDENGKKLAAKVKRLEDIHSLAAGGGDELDDEQMTTAEVFVCIKIRRRLHVLNTPLFRHIHAWL